ncbi:MAG: YlcI/YnfO family protein [Wenzhouxiangella sp.]|jgi:predicted transcriptional regulator|nr:YlcI/YnfO family protein [Wenzhouxiangella sp.]
MKTATIPPLRVTPELRRDAESVLREGESLSNFSEEALRKQIERRKMQKAFIDRGLEAAELAKSTGRYSSKDEVMDSLQAILNESKREK